MEWAVTKGGETWTEKESMEVWNLVGLCYNSGRFIGSYSGMGSGTGHRTVWSEV